ncbi:fibrous sheath CABYR-binding protein-like [Thrips palmi]|uniref:Fibrous sheath CABYR-binding protein-like n=1 Tax=Thrips palmi TaxID=161013 RepID=A0A6P8ZRQ7_THRPL|nr:fibrous sheath CABYR-binding protein-like [Thrips palmi]
MAPLTALLVAVAMAACTSAMPADPLPSLQHDTDVVRLAPPNRRMFLVDVIRPPLPTPDAVLTNEVDTSADSDLPRLVRVLVSAPAEEAQQAQSAEARPDAPPSKADDDDYLPRPAPADGVVGLDVDTEALTRLLPPAEDQQPSAADWGAAPEDLEKAAPAAPAAPAEDLTPPAVGGADFSAWTKQAAEPRSDAPAAPAEAVKEPSEELQPPQSSYAGLWELFEGLKMAQADEAVAEASSTAKETVDAKELVTELVPPSIPAAGAVDYWTQPAAEARSDDAVAETTEAVKDVSEPATDLVPPPPGLPELSEWTKVPAKEAAARADVPEPADAPTRDSYSPEKPSSGEAGTDDFLSLGASPPASDAASEFAKDQKDKDSYLPGAGELRPLSEGPVFDDFLAIGEPPKEDDAKDSYVPQDSTATERDSYMPQESAAAKEDTVELTPPAEQTSAQKDSKSGSDHLHDHVHADGLVHEHVHDEVHATTPRPSSDEGDHDHGDHGEEADDDDDDVDGDGVKTSQSQDFRKRRHVCKLCGGYGRAPVISVTINKGYGGGGGYCDSCGRPVYQQPQVVYKPVTVYKPVPVYQEPSGCNYCNQPPPPPPPCHTCGGGGGGGYSQSFSQSSSQSSSSSFSGGWGKK